jgi:K+-sensing histidine kinase KdpD
MRAAPYPGVCGCSSKQHLACDVLQPGQRLYERAPGFGLELSITRELAELHGGSLDFQKSPAGGAESTLMVAVDATIVYKPGELNDQGREIGVFMT